ncbi:MAG: OmpA family protein [Bdellovibrio sp.]
MKTLILVTLVIFGSLTHAQDATTSAMEFGREEAEKRPEGLLPFIALGGGYTGYDTAGSVEGTPATIKLLGSYYLPGAHGVFDLGYGVNNQQFSQSTQTNLDTSITGGALELAARYRWDNRWQAGIVANELYEQGKRFTADQGDATFVGLQAMRDFPISASWLGRIGARAMALTNNTAGLVTMYLVDLQFGWNPGAYKPTARQTAATENPVEETTAANANPEQTEMQPPARPVTRATPEPILKDVTYSSLAGEGALIQFSPSQVAVSGADERKISKLADALADNKDLFDRIEVNGYTDATGSPEINQKISEERAKEVRSVLRKHGLRDINVVAMGKGSANSTGVSSKDRRADLVFVGVKDEDKLRDAINKATE